MDMTSPTHLTANEIRHMASSLPGCNWDSLVTDLSRHDQTKGSQDWHVKTSAHQVISTGVGVDAGRTLQSQADFMNSKCSTEGGAAPLRGKLTTRLADEDSPRQRAFLTGPTVGRQREKARRAPAGLAATQTGENSSAALSYYRIQQNLITSGTDTDAGNTLVHPLKDQSIFPHQSGECAAGERGNTIGHCHKKPF